MQAIGGGIEAHGTVPDGLQVLDHQRVRQEVLRRGTDGHF